MPKGVLRRIGAKDTHLGLNYHMPTRVLLLRNTTFNGSGTPVFTL